MCAAQEQAIRTNYIKYHIDKTSESPLCRLGGKKGESVHHITSGCEKLAQKEDKRQHDNVSKKVHRDICKKNGLEHSEDLSEALIDCGDSYDKFENIFTSKLDKHAPKKRKWVRGNHKPHINKELRKVIMKRSRLKNKANKSKKPIDISNFMLLT